MSEEIRIYVADLVAYNNKNYMVFESMPRMICSSVDRENWQTLCFPDQQFQAVSQNYC